MSHFVRVDQYTVIIDGHRYNKAGKLPVDESRRRKRLYMKSYRTAVKKRHECMVDELIARHNDKCDESLRVSSDT